MEIKRDRYLKQLISLGWNGQVKVITGIRRCGKSYLLGTIFRNHLLSMSVPEDHIISIQLDLARDIRFRNPLELSRFVRNAVSGKKDRYYLFVDEIQMSDEVSNPYNPEGKKITFYDALNDLRELDNLDIYVTGSSSKMLSSDILTEFRGRSDEIHVYPLNFSEFYGAVGGDKSEAFDAYAYYGGMPFVLGRPDDTSKRDYLDSLVNEVYLKDIVERKHVEREDVLSQILDLLCSSVGSLTNPKRIADALCSREKVNISPNTIKSYIDYFKDAFLFSESKRYDVKGESYFDTPSKYYCTDVGLRNARLGFRQQEMTHLMENIVYNELRIRGFLVDVGVVYGRELNEHKNSVRIPKEIDFVATKDGKRSYIQCAYAIENEEKKASEVKPLMMTGDFFSKILIRKDVGKRWYDELGILNINLIDFLLDDTVI